MNLSLASLYKPYVIDEVIGDEKTRLQAIGLMEGTTLKVLSKAPFKGPFICEVNGAELAIDYVLTQDIRLV